MVRQLDAVLEAGVLRPLEPLALSEPQRVRLTLDDQPSPGPASAAVLGLQHDPRRQQEMLWLTDHAKHYAGQWVAPSGSNLIAHGSNPAIEREQARAAGVDRPLLAHLPNDTDDLPFAGW